MADKEYVKRVNYFTHQFLEAKDFTAEQQYHLKCAGGIIGCFIRGAWQRVWRLRKMEKIQIHT